MATSLFGPSPLELQQQQQAGLQARATQYAQLNPLERAAQGMYQAGSNIGGGIAGMMGIQDPAMARQSAITTIAANYDRNDPADLIKLANELATKGFMQESEMAATKAQELAKAGAENKFKLSEAALKNAQAGAVPGEIDLRAAQATKARFDQLSEEQSQAATKAYLQAQGMPENQIDAIIKNPKARESYLTLVQDKTQVIEANGRSLLINKGDGSVVKDLGTATDKSTKITVPLGDALAKVYGESEKKAQGTEWAKAGDAYNAALPMIDKLGQMHTAMQSAYTGVGADTKLAFAKGLSAFGIPVDINKLSNTEYANSVGSQLIQSIARVFPGSQSNKELDQLLKSKPNISQELPTILRLIRQVQDEMRASTLTYQQLAPLSIEERSTTNPNILQGKNYAKLSRYRALEAQAAGGKPMASADIAEAKKLQQELGVQ